MKKTHLLATSFSLTVILLTACKKDHQQTSPPSGISADHSSIRHITTAGTESITINSSADWTLSAPSTATWLQVDKTSGSNGSTKVTLTFTDNLGTNPLVTDLILKSSGVADQKIHVVQDGSANYLDVDKNTAIAKLSETKSSMIVTSNTNWTLSIPTSATWVKADQTSGSAGTTKVNFTLTVGSGTDPRSTDITINSAASGIAPAVLNLTQVPDYGITDFSPTIASIGSDVTINGFFGTNPIITVNGVAATVKSNSATQIVFTVPTGATSGKINVNCDGGISMTSAADLGVIITVFSKVYGGFQPERVNAINRTSDGGYITVGFTQSNDGDVNSSHGRSDIWVVKLDASGNIVWQNALGGTNYDYGFSVANTTDGGYIVAGYTYSINGDVTGNHGNADAWIIKLDATGNKLWQKTLGGSNYDEATSIITTSDGYIVAGSTYSNDGDVIGTHLSGDAWILKLDLTGNIIWQKTLGGTDREEALAIKSSSDGGYIMAGFTQSNDGDISGNHGGADSWVVKLDGNGNKLWQKTLGGSNFDEANSITTTSDGGFIMAGYTESNDGDISGNHGSADAWIVRFDVTGNIIWKKTLGGTNSDKVYSITSTSDGSYIVAGYTQSNDGDISATIGNYDAWMIKLDTNGNKLGQKTFGGSNGISSASAITTTSDGAYILAGYTSCNNNGDVPTSHGTEDSWVLKFKF